MVKVAEMSGKKFMENVLSNPIFQKERTALDYFCVVFLILKQCSSSMRCDLFTVHNTGSAGNYFELLYTQYSIQYTIRYLTSQFKLHSYLKHLP